MCLLGICEGMDGMLVLSESVFVEGGVGRRDGISCIGSMTAAIVSDGMLLEVKRFLSRSISRDFNSRNFRKQC